MEWVNLGDTGQTIKITCVGDVMGKYHPHGDSAIYDAMVRMAQDFSYHLIIDGHGNFVCRWNGAAAMRYAEARMSKIALGMLPRY